MNIANLLVGDIYGTLESVKKSMFLIVYKTKYDDIVGVHEHIMKQVHYYNKMNFSKADIGETSIIW